MTKLVHSADQLCVALEETLDEHLAATLALREVRDLLGDDFDHFDKGLRDWQQVPTPEDLSSASLPAGAIASPGLVNQPRYTRSKNAYETTWRISAAVYVRGKDRNQVQARVKNWIAVLRIIALRHPSLGGVATALTWFGEDYTLLSDRRQAQTIGAGAASFNVTADVPDPKAFLAGLPTASTTTPTLTVN